MRETLLFPFANANTANGFRRCQIGGVPSHSTSAVSVAEEDAELFAGGILGDHSAWRIIRSNANLIIEPLWSGNGERNGAVLNLPSLPTCEPVILMGADGSESLVLSFRNDLLRLHIPRGRENDVTAERVELPPGLVTAMHVVESSREPREAQSTGSQNESRVILGFSTGLCGSVTFDSNSVFQPPTFTGYTTSLVDVPAEEVAMDADNTSIVSALSNPPDEPPVEAGAVQSLTSASARSVGSSSSRRLLSRLFGTSAGADQAASIDQGTSEHHTTQTRRVAPDFDDDPVAAITESRLGAHSLLVLHSSGRLRALVRTERGEYALAGAMHLPVRLSSVGRHFLRSLSDGVAVAVVGVDQNPRPDAIHICLVNMTMSRNRHVALRATTVQVLEGPNDPLAGVSIHGDCLFAATDSGDINVLQLTPAPLEGRNRSGLPNDTLWTAKHDLLDSSGQWAVADDVLKDHARLLAARRFSVPTIARALRVPHLASASTDEIASVAIDAAQAEPVQDDSPWDRIVARAARQASIADMKIVGTQRSRVAGILVVRTTGVFALRSLIGPSELDVIAPRCTMHAKTSELRGPTYTDQVARLLGGHASLQVASSEVKRSGQPSPSFADARSVLQLGTALSSVQPDRALCELAAMHSPSPSEDKVGTLSEWIAPVSALLSNRREMLLFLNQAKEMNALAMAVPIASEYLPASAFFATGLVELDKAVAMTKERSSSPGADRSMRSINVHVDAAFSALSSSATIVLDPEGDGVLLGVQPQTAEARAADLDCVATLAGVVDSIPSDEATETAEIADIAKAARDAKAQAPENLGFQVIQRSARIFEQASFHKVAAAAAYRAMKVAPRRADFETMRALAFQRFLDVGDLESALDIVLTERPVPDADDESVLDYGSALRDCVSLLVDTAVETGRFAWLQSYSLPPVVAEIGAMALARRARSYTVVPDEVLEYELAPGSRRASNDGVAQSMRRRPSAYEYLLTWLIRMGNVEHAASCALEWYERLSSEGLAKALRTAQNVDRNGTTRVIPALLVWSRLRYRALAHACALVRSLGDDSQYVTRTRHSVVSEIPTSCGPDNVVDLAWLSRRHLLARAQMNLLAVQESTSRKLQNPRAPKLDLILSDSGKVLLDGEAAVNFAVVSVLGGCASRDAIDTALALALAWLPEHGDFALSEIVRTAAGHAARSGTGKRGRGALSYVELADMLEVVLWATHQNKAATRRNWYLVAAEGALSTSCVNSLPQWLIGAAAWGVRPFGAGRNQGEEQDSPQFVGDPCGLARALLINNQPVAAAQVLVDRRDKRIIADEALPARAVTYSTYEATLKTLKSPELSCSAETTYFIDALSRELDFLVSLSVDRA